jgi:hypothetical protein
MINMIPVSKYCSSAILQDLAQTDGDRSGGDELQKLDSHISY